jgi:glutathione S-transferase
MQLHYAPGTIATASVLTLFETGKTADLIRVDFAKSQQNSPEYLAINPKGRVPALVTDQGILTETGAILHYLADGTDLVPSDPMQRARMHELMYYLASTMHVNHAHKLRGHRWADQDASHQDMTAKVPETMAASCAYVETQLRGPYLLGDRPCLADFYLFAICTWLAGDGVDIANYPQLSNHFQMVSSRDSAIKAKDLGVWRN